MMGLSPWEIMLVMLILLFLFGAKRLPEIGRSLGQSIKEFKGITKELTGSADELRREAQTIKRDVERL